MGRARRREGRLELVDHHTPGYRDIAEAERFIAVAGAGVVFCDKERHLCSTLLPGEVYDLTEQGFAQAVARLFVLNGDGDFWSAGREVRMALVRRRPIPQPHSACGHVELVEGDDPAVALRVPLVDVAFHVR